MRVKIASVVTVVDAKGAAMDEGETITMFNDLCVFAPGVLIDTGILWQAIDPQTVRATFTNASYTVRADLSFDDRGELTNFIADGRADGTRRDTRMELGNLPTVTPPALSRAGLLHPAITFRHILYRTPARAPAMRVLPSAPPPVVHDRAPKDLPAVR